MGVTVKMGGERYTYGQYPDKIAVGIFADLDIDLGLIFTKD